jgi:hypothetical protein
MRAETLLYALLVVLLAGFAIARGFSKTQALYRSSSSPWEIAGVVAVALIIAVFTVRRVMRD